MRPVCEGCKRPIPEGVESVILPGLAYCGPCLWDSYTPWWRRHQAHDEPWETCRQCEREEAPA